MLLSVVIPAFNVEAYIDDCLASVEAAVSHVDDPTAIEVVLVDDASTDQTPAALERHALRHGYRHYRNAANLGLAAARNRGIRAAAGQYVLFLDADNRLTPDGLARVTQLVRANPQVDAVILGMEVIDDRGAVTGRFYGDRIPVDPPVQLREAPQSLLMSNFLDNFAVFRRELVLQNPYDESLRALEDWDLWIRLIFVRRAPVAFSSDIYGQYRIRPGSLTDLGNRGDIRHLDALIKIYARALLLGRTIDLAPSVSQHIHATLRALSLEFINVSGYQSWRVPTSRAP